MAEPDTPASLSTSRLWTSRILSGIVVIFMLFDTTIHLVVPPPVTEAFAQLGCPVSLSVVFGIIELVCTLLYLIPQTSIFGAVLLTGYLGGAVATNVRVGNPLFSHSLFPVYLGILAWGGLYLRNSKARALFPF